MGDGRRICHPLVGLTTAAAVLFLGASCASNHSVDRQHVFDELHPYRTARHSGRLVLWRDGCAIPEGAVLLTDGVSPSTLDTDGDLAADWPTQETCVESPFVGEGELIDALLVQLVMSRARIHDEIRMGDRPLDQQTQDELRVLDRRIGELAVMPTEVVDIR